jgi:hypothetical protein
MIVELLQKLVPFFTNLKVEDEGGYWSTRSRKALGENMKQINTMIEEIKRTRPGARGPIKIDSGRILDVLQ